MKFLPWGKKDKQETLPVPYNRPVPPPPVLQRYAVERVNPSLPAGFDQHNRSASYGHALPRVDTSPNVIEMLTLQFMCSHFRKPFTGIYGKWQIGVPYRLLFNVLPHEAAAVMQEAAQRGVRVRQARQGIVPLDDLDLCNWQCLHCGRGHIQGDRWDFFFCGRCGSLQCASSVVSPRNAAATVFCVGCNVVYPFGDDIMQAVTGTKHIMQRR